MHQSQACGSTRAGRARAQITAASCSQHTPQSTQVGPFVLAHHPNQLRPQRGPGLRLRVEERLVAVDRGVERHRGILLLVRRLRVPLQRGSGRLDLAFQPAEPLPQRVGPTLLELEDLGDRRDCRASRFSSVPRQHRPQREGHTPRKKAPALTERRTPLPPGLDQRLALLGGVGGLDQGAGGLERLDLVHQALPPHAHPPPPPAPTRRQPAESATRPGARVGSGPRT